MRHEMLEVDPEHPGEDALREAVSLLRKGGVVAYPTETYYGLAADATNARACAEVFDLKGRPGEKALPCIVSGVPQLVEIALALSSRARLLAERFWPGPLSLVVVARPGIAAASGDGSVAVRASGLALARLLASGLGRPVTATSANRSGAPPPTTASGVASELGEGVALILDGGACPGGLPSTLVDVRGASPVLLRAGRVDFDEVLRVFHEGTSP